MKLRYLLPCLLLSTHVLTLGGHGQEPNDSARARGPVLTAVEIAKTSGAQEALYYLEEISEARQRRAPRTGVIRYDRNRALFALRLYETAQEELGDAASAIVMGELEYAQSQFADPELHYLEGKLREVWGDSVGAQEAYARALDISPSDAKSARGFLKLEEKHLAEERMSQRDRDTVRQ